MNMMLYFYLSHGQMKKVILCKMIMYRTITIVNFNTEMREEAVVG